jgi:enamine deaminase RidA (YjgF/YER057c/UK114 family)
VRGSIERFGPGFVRAGKWVFGTGLRAPDAQTLFHRMNIQLKEAGSSLSHVARLDQYYPEARCVPPYHEARRQVFGEGRVAPSTSVIVSALCGAGAQMDVQVIAATEASGYAPQPVQAGLNRPDASGYTPCLRVGELLFMAGQLARDASGRLAAHGTASETEYLLEERIVPALAAAESGLDLVLKAQAYLSRPQDVEVFWAAWRKAFRDCLPPTTVVALRHPAFLTTQATVEVNIVAAHASARGRVRSIAGEVQARALDGLLFLSGLEGKDIGEIMNRARRLFTAAGADLSNAVRALVFHDQAPPPVEPSLPVTFVKVQGGLTVDLWGYAP